MNLLSELLPAGSLYVPRLITCIVHSFVPVSSVYDDNFAFAVVCIVIKFMYSICSYSAFMGLLQQ